MPGMFGKRGGGSEWGGFDWWNRRGRDRACPKKRGLAVVGIEGYAKEKGTWLRQGASSIRGR